jgi:hypothetical protein
LLEICATSVPGTIKEVAAFFQKVDGFPAKYAENSLVLEPLLAHA